MTNKADTLTAIDAAYDKLHGLVAGIDETHGTWAGAVGTWSVVNLLQHIESWVEVMTDSLERIARGERPTPEGVDYSNADAWNAKFVEIRGEQTMAQALALFEQHHAAFRTAVDGVPDDRFGENKSVNRIVFAACLEHYDEHHDQIAAYLAG